MKKGTAYILFVLITLVTSCRYIGHIDGIFTKNLSSEPQKTALAGTWEIDKQSYDLIKEQYDLKGHKVRLHIYQNGTFVAENLPDFINDGFGKSVNKRFYDARGKWDIDKIEDFWCLSICFMPGELNKVKTFTTFELLINNDKLIIWVSIGDPDEGNRLLFQKVN